MKTLPDNVVRYGRTPVYTQDSMPKNYRRGHTTKPGVWATLHVVAGKLHYRILGDTPEEHILEAGSSAVIDPVTVHEVEGCGDVQFYLDFYRAPGR